MRNTNRAVLVVMSAVALTGCAINPVVDWDSPIEPAGPGRPVDSMEGARSYADAYKRALHAKASQYVSRQAQLNDSILGLGVFSLGAAVFKAHRDVYMGGGLLAATGYSFGVQDLGKTRLDVYQSGISATNCAVAAVAPLSFSVSELHDVAAASTRLSETVSALARNLAIARTAYVQASLDDNQKKQATDQIDSAAASYQGAINVLNDAAALPGRVSAAAGGLKSTVETISAQVDKLASSTVGDPSSVQRSLASLASSVGAFTPGLKLDSAFNSAIAAAAGGGGAAGGGPAIGPGLLWKFEKGTGGKPAPAPVRTDLTKELSNLAEAQAKVDVVAKPLGSRLLASKALVITDALRACGVNDSVIAMRVTPDMVTIKLIAGQAPPAAEFRVIGGVKNYTGRIVDVNSGIELVPPHAGEGTFQVKVPQTVTKSTDLTVNIEDSSNPPQTSSVKIKIQAP